MTQKHLHKTQLASNSVANPTVTALVYSQATYLPVIFTFVGNKKSRLKRDFEMVTKGKRNTVQSFCQQVSGDAFQVVDASIAMHPKG